MELLQLNDDCVSQIFKYLSLDEQLSLTDVCTRFRDVVLYIVWRRQFLHSPLRTDTTELRKLSLKQFQHFFSVISAGIVQLVIADIKSEAFSSYLERFGHRPDLDFYLSLYYPMLKVLECEYPRIHDGHVRIITEKCPQLEVLRVSSSYVTGAHIKNIQTLKKLHAQQCGLEREHLHNLLSKLKKLEVLDVIENPHCPLSLNGLKMCNLIELRLSESAVTKKLVEHFHNLVKLQLLHVNNLLQLPHTNSAWTSFMEQFGSRIRYLDLYNTRQYTSMLSILPLDSFGRLEEIKIRCSPSTEHINSFLQLPTLKTLNIESRLFEANYLQIVENSCAVKHFQLEGICISRKDFEEMILKLIKHVKELCRNAKRQSEGITLHLQEPLDAAFRTGLKAVTESEEYINQNVLKVKFFRKPLELIQPMATYVQFGF